ncbi:ankyrin repeat protein [Colletotrichum tofieldiae]|nr:ankyrin repeat protein [Colletotrichum tofieldiae]GKT69728.1 ankyrin repeat protein [Colletotrichum tofieldiae]GKT92740.1 ankyrin repeat protein [Colletotrichum tofieldiae]
MSAAQRKVMLKACEKAVTHFDKDSCLLCDKWSPLTETDGNSNSFRSHLAKHFQELACEAIPLAIEGLEIRDVNSDDDPAISDDDEQSTPSEDTSGARPVIIGKHIEENKSLARTVSALAHILLAAICVITSENSMVRLMVLSSGLLCVEGVTESEEETIVTVLMQCVVMTSGPVSTGEVLVPK